MRERAAKGTNMSMLSRARRFSVWFTLSVCMALWSAQPLLASAQSTAANDYAIHCAGCHGTERLGGSGPALLPENLERLRKPQALQTIREGRMATQMPGFSAKFSAAEAQALADFIYTPPVTKPVWGETEIRASRIAYVSAESLPAKPVFS